MKIISYFHTLLLLLYSSWIVYGKTDSSSSSGGNKLEELFGTNRLYHWNYDEESGEQLVGEDSLVSLLDKTKVIGIYFSASW
jgi:hypothetical protein